MQGKRYFSSLKIDLGDQGDITLFGEWEEVDGRYWRGQARGYLMNEFAEATNVPHGTTVEGTLEIFPINSEEAKEKGIENVDWEYWEFDKFRIVEISPVV